MSKMHNLTKFCFSYTFNRSVVSICPNLMSLPGSIYIQISSQLLLDCDELNKCRRCSTQYRNILRDNFLTIWVFVVPLFLLYSFFVSLTLLLDIRLWFICCVCVCYASYNTVYSKTNFNSLERIFRMRKHSLNNIFLRKGLFVICS